MQVTKRDGRIVQFNKNKIIKALEQAFMELDKELTDESKEKIETIALSIEKENRDLSVEEIQDIIEKKLMASNRKDVAKTYILYRSNRTLERDKRSKLNKSITRRLKATNIENQNANVDERSFGGKMGAVSSDVLKEYALNNCMCRKSKENHLKNRIYIHDLDSYAIGSHNCLTIPFDDLLAKGFNTRQTDVRPANSINTAFQLVAVIFQLQSLQQFGGVSASHLDWTMIPYVRKSFYKHYNDVSETLILGKLIELEKEEIVNTSIEDKVYKPKHWWNFIKKRIYRIAIKRTNKELSQAVEGMYHNLNY
jgi:ribonucleoside-triphosphate reductase